MTTRLSTPIGTWAEGEMLVSPAFISLTGAAPQVLLLFRCKQRLGPKPKPLRDSKGRLRARPILNNGEITFYYSEAVKRGITRPRFQRAIDELVEKGFIDIARPGNGYARIPTLYAISDRWRKYGLSDFVYVQRLKDTRNRRPKVENADVPYAGNADVPCGVAARDS